MIFFFYHFEFLITNSQFFFEEAVVQSPLVGEGRFLERQPVSHELHRFWRYVKPLFSIFLNPQLIQKCNFFSFFFF